MDQEKKRPPYILQIVGVFLLYGVFAKIGLEYAVIGHTVTLMWPPSGIALAAILIGGYRLWSGIALGALVAYAWSGLSATTLLIITVGSTLEPLLGALLLKRLNNFSITLDKTSDVLALGLAAFVSTLLGSLLGTVGLLIGGDSATVDFTSTWLIWWLGDSIGILVISPFILAVFAVNRGTRSLYSPAKIFETLALIVALALIAQATFGNVKLTGMGYFPFSLSLFPFAIWSALRFGLFGAACVALMTSLFAFYNTLQGVGPLVLNSAMDSQILWCLFTGLMAVTGLILAAVNSGREKALTALKNATLDLEGQVQKRTNELIQTNLELSKTLIERRHLQLEMNQISEERQKMIGQELHDGLGQQLIGIAFLVSSLHERLAAKSAPELPSVYQVKQLLDEAMSVIRLLSRGLYPVALETGSFSSALQHLANYTQNTSGIPCAAQCTNTPHVFDKTIALNLYRIAQEAVSNALRHSKAQHIEIKLSVDGERYTLSVEDNGVGFPDQSLGTIGTLGLRSMRCRADLIGAEIKIRENSGGASIVVTGSIKRETQVRKADRRKNTTPQPPLQPTKAGEITPCQTKPKPVRPKPKS